MMNWRSFLIVYHSMNFVLLNSEFTTLFGTCESCVAVLIVDVFVRSCAVETRREVGVGFAVDVAFIWNEEVMPVSKYRSILSTAKDTTKWTICWSHQLLEIKWKQEWIMTKRSNIVIIFIPSNVCKASDRSPKLCSY